jgi:hypothetical protein
MVRGTITHYLSLIYIHWDLNSTANRFMCEMMTYKEEIFIKERLLDSIKVSGIVGSQKGVHICVHKW